MSGDRERCLEAGMNDYVAKPIRVDELVAAIKRAPRRAGGPEPAASAVRADREAIDTASLVRLLDGTGGDTDFVGELIEQFLNDAPGLVDAARKGLAVGEIDDVRRAAHTLKSNAATFGARGLADRSRELEDAAKQGALDDAETRIERIAQELDGVRSALPAAWVTVAGPSS
jgi:HPt (histidine-containing phosphotransfer) domain-containing protein